MKISSENYGINNEMEEIVDLAVIQVLSEDATACGCPQCQIDMKCIILNRLQAKYHAINKNEPAKTVKLSELDRDLFNKVVAESYRALMLVKREPRHKIDRTFLVNCSENIVSRSLGDILKQQKRELNYNELSHVLADALNNLDSRYTTTPKGEVFCRTVEVDPSYLAKVYSAIFNALEGLSQK